MSLAALLGVGGQPAHESTTAHVEALYPFMGEPGLGARGVYVGRELLSGAGWYYDPWELYEAGVLKGAGMVVAGMIGSGKSSLVKTYLARQACFGRRSVVIDPKGEYGPLAQWFGGQPLRLSPGGDLRLNPLEPGAGREGQLAVLAAITATSLGRPLGPAEYTALDLALAAAARPGTPTLPAVQRALLEPEPTAARAEGALPADLVSDGRQCAHALRRLCEGDLRGMLDGPTSGQVDLAAPVVVIDLSALWGSAGIGIVMICVRAWLQARIAERPGIKWICVLDEAWKCLSSLAAAEWLREQSKLSRALGVQNVFIIHRASDLGAVGPEGSAEVAIARGLLEDAETRVILAQPPGELTHARAAFGLGAAEAGYLAGLSRGVALWLVGRRAAIVQHRLSGAEQAMVDTDQAMREPARAGV